MITAENLIWDIRHILKKTSDDVQIFDRHLLSKITNYRGGAITASHDAFHMVNPEWVQHFRDEPLTQVASGDVPNYTGRSDVKFGKIAFPATLSGKNGEFGTVRIAPTSGWHRIYPIDIDKLQLHIEVNDPILQHYVWYIRTGTSFYFYNYFGSINADLVLADPMDGFVIRTEFVTELIAKESYTVYNGPIVYAGSTINPYETFQAVAEYTTFTGEGQVKFQDEKKKMDIRQRYPIDPGMAQDIIYSILSRDYQIERQSIADVINDSADTLNALKAIRT